MDVVSKRVAVGPSTGNGCQLITLAFDTRGNLRDVDFIRSVIGATRGVDAVEANPTRPHVWVFGNGTLNPEALCDVLARWGFGAYVLESQLTLSV